MTDKNENIGTSEALSDEMLENVSGGFGTKYYNPNRERMSLDPFTAQVTVRGTHVMDETVELG